ncbi:MAG: helix-turn-helix transcriptional regulator [Candidatus Roseilinea sp.]|nr:MAG: helix-turn-helix transcriptional regulator [Candidatus Roseilinea sp.]
MKQELTLRQAEQDIIHLCQSGLDSIALRRAAAQRLRKAIPFDACCWGTIDPGTLLITSEVSEGIPDFAFALAAENEYLMDDVNKFSVLARSSTRFGILSQSTQDALKQSHRFHSVMSTIGARHELRVAFVCDRECWGGVTLFRTADSPDFTSAEGRFLGRLSAPLAEGFRLALLMDRSVVAANDPGPGLIVLGESGAVEAMNPAAHAWLADLVEPGFRVPEGWLPAPIHEVAMRARAIARTISNGDTPEHLQAHLRVRTHSGQWLMLHGSHMIGSHVGAGQTAVILELARSSEIARLLMLAYDLTARERELLQLVLQGLASSEMALTLHISVHTVQDHLKSIFDKVGVHSRGELIARVLGDHYFPHVGPR